MPERAIHLSTTVPVAPAAVLEFPRGHGGTISATTDAVECAGGSRVSEHVVVRAPRLVLGYLAGQALVAHTRTFRLLPDALA